MRDGERGEYFARDCFFFGTEEFAGRDIENKGIDRHGLCHGSYLLLS